MSGGGIQGDNYYNHGQYHIGPNGQPTANWSGPRDVPGNGWSLNGGQQQVPSPQLPGGSGGNMYQPQPQAPDVRQPGGAPQFYRDAFGNMAVASPGLAGRQAQWGPNHAIGRYDQQGVWNPLAEQNSTNGALGRSFGAGVGGVHPGFGGGQQVAAWQAGPMMSGQQALQQAQQSGDQRGALMAQAQMGGPSGNTSPAQMAAAQAGNWNAAKGTATVAPGSTRTVPRRK